MMPFFEGPVGKKRSRNPDDNLECLFVCLFLGKMNGKDGVLEKRLKEELYININRQTERDLLVEKLGVTKGEGIKP